MLKATKVDQERLEKEMYSKKKSRSFMLQRQLVGFYLLQELKEGDQRLPVEVFSRLGTLGHMGLSPKRRRLLSWPGWTSMAHKTGPSWP